MNSDKIAIFSEMLAKEPKIVKCNDLLQQFAKEIKTLPNFITKIQMYDIGKYLVVELSKFQLKSISDVDNILFKYHHKDIEYFIRKSNGKIKEILINYLNIYDAVNVANYIKYLFRKAPLQLIPIGNIVLQGKLNDLTTVNNLKELTNFLSDIGLSDLKNIVEKYSVKEEITDADLNTIEYILITSTVSNFLNTLLKAGNSESLVKCINFIKKLNVMKYIISKEIFGTELFHAAEAPELRISKDIYEVIAEEGLGICYEDTKLTSEEMKKLGKSFIPFLLTLMVYRCCFKMLKPEVTKYDVLFRYLMLRLLEISLLRYIIYSLIFNLEISEELFKLRCY